MGTERERRQTIGRGPAPLRQPGRRAPPRLRRQHADRHRHRELRAVRREPPEGDRGGHRHPLRHRREAPVRGHPRDRRARARRRRSASSSPRRSGTTSSRAGIHRREGQGPGHAPAGPQGQTRSLCPSRSRPVVDQVKEVLQQARRQAGDQERRRAETGPDPPGRAQSEEFKALWDRIKHKTTYRVEFDNEELIEDCIKALDDAPPIAKTRLQWRKADLAIGKAGVEAKETAESAPVVIEESDIELPDLLTELQDRTQLTRRSLVRILTESGRLDDFKRNPQQFIELAAEAINRTKRLALVDGIKYQRIGDEDYYAQELFEQEELTGYLKNMLAADEVGLRARRLRLRRTSSAPSPSSWRRTRPSRSTPSFPAGSRSRRRSAPTTPTGPCWSRWTEPSACTSSSRPRAASLPTTSATRRARRSTAARRTSRPSGPVRILPVS